MSNRKTVDLTVSQLIEDLANGQSWLKKDDLGFGSIQDKYGANDIQIKTIQKHPKLIGLEPSLTIFRVIDDTKEEEVKKAAPAEQITKAVTEVVKEKSSLETDLSATSTAQHALKDTSEVEAFFNI
jgi:hypothetical protein